MRQGFKLWHKPEEGAVWSETGQFPTLEEARGATHTGDPTRAYTDPGDWRQTPSGSYALNEERLDRTVRPRSPWMIQPVQVPEGDADRIELAAELGFRYGGYDGAHHKQWVIDQMLRTLLGDRYEGQVTECKAGEDGPDTYNWDTGIAP